MSENLEIIFVCKACGSERIQERAFVDLNSTNPSIDFIVTNEWEDHWCKECLDHCHIVLKEQYHGRKNMDQ